jgi:hypothetical protein
MRLAGDSFVGKGAGMKPRVLRGIVGVGAMLHAFSAVAAESAATPKQPAAPAAAKVAPKPEVKKEEPVAKIEGIEIKRGAGFMGIAVVGGNFKLTFYDAKKKPVVPDVARAVLRWPVNYKPLDERTVLNLSGDGKSMTSGKAVKPPLVFKLFITLVPPETADEAASETYVVDFKG